MWFIVLNNIVALLPLSNLFSALTPNDDDFLAAASPPTMNVIHWARLIQAQAATLYFKPRFAKAFISPIARLDNSGRLSRSLYFEVSADIPTQPFHAPCCAVAAAKIFHQHGSRNLGIHGYNYGDRLGGAGWPTMIKLFQQSRFPWNSPGFSFSKKPPFGVKTRVRSRANLTRVISGVMMGPR